MTQASTTWATGLKSSRSGATAPLEHQPLPDEAAPWLVEYDLDQERGALLIERLGKRPWTLWRYRELLPIQSWDP